MWSDTGKEETEMEKAEKEEESGEDYEEEE